MECTLLSRVQPNLEAGLNKPPRPPAAASRQAQQEVSEEGNQSQ